MSDILFQPARETADEDATLLAQLLDEMQRLNAQMCRDQADIEGIKAETDLLKEAAAHYKAQTAQIKTETERLRLEGDTLHATARAALDRVKAMVA